jgi:hypothetical protein
VLWSGQVVFERLEPSQDRSSRTGCWDRLVQLSLVEKSEKFIKRQATALYLAAERATHYTYPFMSQCLAMGIYVTYMGKGDLGENCLETRI